jgi:AcrR family transcriptional regulator
MTTQAPVKIRDAERSREAILAAAERLFAEQGYDRASLSDIATSCGLSRGTPSYFFGSKETLYAEVIERAFAAREQATIRAFQPVHAWCEDETSGVDELRNALRSAAADYMAFLVRHRAFVKLIMRDELAGGSSIRHRKGRSTAMADAFGALRAAGRIRGLSLFAVEDAVLLFVALTFAPMSYANTLMRAVKRDLRKPRDREQQVELAVSQLMLLLSS